MSNPALVLRRWCFDALCSGTFVKLYRMRNQDKLRQGSKSAFAGRSPWNARWQLQRSLAHKKTPLRKTLQWPYAQGPTVVLGGGQFFVSEVPM